MIKNVGGQTVFRLILCGWVAVLFSCQKSNRLQSPYSTGNQTNSVIEENLTPTSTFEDDDGPIVKDGVTYQAPPKKIKNPSGELIKNRVKFESTKIVYDPAKHQLRISGTARVLDENKKEIGSTEFDLSGSQDPSKNEIFLKETNPQKLKSSEKPVIRGTVTCLLMVQDEYDCSSSFVDFFISFKKLKYTEQLELKKKTPDVVPPAQPKPTDAGDDNSDDDGKQAEGQENSIEGRYQGRAETVDLKTIFDGDEDADNDESQAQPVQPKPVVIVTPTTPTATTTPTSTPRAVPTPASQDSTSGDTATDKKEKQLTRDLQQLKNGDVRQINQSIGFPDNGNLRNATSLFMKQQGLSSNAHFEIVDPKRNRHYATYEVAEMVTRMGKEISDIFNRKLYVGNASQQNGGKIYSLKDGKIQYDKNGSPVLAHASHQAGVDVDIAYPSSSESVKWPTVVTMTKERQYNPSSYSVQKTYELLKFTFSQPDITVERVFMDRTIKKALCDYAKSKNEFNSSSKDVVNSIFNSIDHVDGHGDHFHVRLKCSAYDPGCRQKLYSVNKGCN